MKRRRRFDWQPAFDSQEQIAEEENEIIERLTYASDSERASLLERLKEVTRAKAHFVSTTTVVDVLPEQATPPRETCGRCLSQPCSCERYKR
jgi:hypothetical protein